MPAVRPAECNAWVATRPDDAKKRQGPVAQARKTTDEALQAHPETVKW